MLSLIWTPAALSSELKPYEGRGWRLVEAQHVISTLKLVDTIEEQDILERLIENTKPSVPLPCQHLHFLLQTPFRYGAAYPHGSRFRRAGQTEGVFYAGEDPQTSVAEIAFYRLRFFAESPRTPWPDNAAEYTAFAVVLNTVAALDLMAPPLNRDQPIWTNPVSYIACQALADDARQSGAQLIRYQSVRDPQKRPNLAVLSCAAFAAADPVDWQSWRIYLSAHGAVAKCEFPKTTLSFPRGCFAADPQIAALNWDR